MPILNKYKYHVINPTIAKSIIIFYFLYIMILLFIIIFVFFILINWSYKYYKYIQLKKKLFPYFLENVVPNNKHYETFKKMTLSIKHNYDKKEYIEHLNFLTQFKTFMDQSNIYSMMSKKEIDQIEKLLIDVIKSNIEGYVVEIGVWKGGCSMWMKTILNYYNSTKKIYLLDTFYNFPTDNNIINTLYDQSYTIDDVMNNFKKFGLYDNNIFFIKGDMTKEFRKIDKIALLRIDTDFYESVMASLEHYYFNITEGGYVVIDDYNNNYANCKQAVIDFRQKYNITNKIHDSDKHSIYWQI